MKTGGFLLRYRWWILAVSILLSVGFGLQIFRAEINPDLESYIYDKMPSRINTNLIEKIFGGDEILLVLFESDDILTEGSLTRIRNVDEKLKEMDGIDETLSLFDAKSIKGTDGAMVVDPVIRRIPKTKSDRENVRQDIRNNELVYKVLVSDDFSMSCIIATLDPDVVDQDVVAAIGEVLDDNPGPETTYIGGLPYIKANMSSEIAREFKLLMIIGLVIMLVMLYVFFRELRGVLLPFTVVVLSILFAMGLIPLLGWQMSIITLLLPIMLIAIANDYGIHMMTKYQEFNASGNSYSNDTITKGVFTSLKTPILLTGITTIAGILSLLSHKMVPAKQLGIVAAAGIAFALLLSLVFIPAMLSILGKSKPVTAKNPSRKRLLDRILVFLGKFVSGNPRSIVAGAALITVLSGIGIFMVDVDTNLENYYPKKHPVRVSSNIIDETFGGSQNISILVEGDILDPAVMHQIDRYETELKKNSAVGNVMSIAGVVREISKSLNDPGDPEYDRIPDNRNLLAQYMELYMMSGDPDDLEHLVDFDFQNAQVSVRINDGSTGALKSVLADIETLSDAGKITTRIGGYGLISADLADLVVRGQVTSLLLALVIIFVMLAIFFRSPVAGLMGIVPLGMTIIILFGWMGLLDIKLDVATALLSSIMIGVGVDYTIHFLWRYREERRTGLEPVPAVRKTLTTTGKGISFNAFSVIFGFSALPFSVFSPIRYFGFLVMVSIFICLAGALVIIPSLILIFRPSFLEEDEKVRRRKPVLLTGFLKGRKTVHAFSNKK